MPIRECTISLEEYQKYKASYDALDADSQHWMTHPHDDAADDAGDQIAELMEMKEGSELKDEGRESFASAWVMVEMLPEAIKNSADAGATEITISLDSDSGEVNIEDNGRGIENPRLKAAKASDMLDFHSVSPKGERIASSKSGKKGMTGGAGAGLAQANAVMRSEGIDGTLHIGPRRDGTHGTRVQLQSAARVTLGTIKGKYASSKAQQGIAAEGICAAAQTGTLPNLSTLGSHGAVGFLELRHGLTPTAAAPAPPPKGATSAAAATNDAADSADAPAVNPTDRRERLEDADKTASKEDGEKPSM